MGAEDAVKGMEGELNGYMKNAQSAMGTGERMDMNMQDFWDGEKKRDQEQTDLLREQKESAEASKSGVPETRDEQFDARLGSDVHGIAELSLDDDNEKSDDERKPGDEPEEPEKKDDEISDDNRAPEDDNEPERTHEPEGETKEHNPDDDTEKHEPEDEGRTQEDVVNDNNAPKESDESKDARENDGKSDQEPGNEGHDEREFEEDHPSEDEHHKEDAEKAEPQEENRNPDDLSDERGDREPEKDREPEEKTEPENTAKSAEKTDPTQKAEPENTEYKLGDRSTKLESQKLEDARTKLKQDGKLTPKLDEDISSLKQEMDILDDFYTQNNTDPSKPATYENMSEKFAELSQNENLTQSNRETSALLSDIAKSNGEFSKHIQEYADGKEEAYDDVLKDSSQREIAKSKPENRRLTNLAEKEGNLKTAFNDPKTALQNHRNDLKATNLEQGREAIESGSKVTKKAAERTTKEVGKKATKTAKQVGKAAAKATASTVKAGVSVAARTICFTNPYTAAVYMGVKLLIRGIEKGIETYKDSKEKADENAKEQMSGNKQVGEVKKTEGQEKKDRQGKSVKAPERSR